VVKHTYCKLLQSPVTHLRFGPNILLSTLLSNTLSLCSFLQCSYQHTTAGMPNVITVVCTLISTFSDTRLEGKKFRIKLSSNLICSEWNLSCCIILPQYLNVCHVSKGFVKYIYGMVLSSSLVTRHQHVLSFICDCF
jgi:hypothetical protein